jgi:hypothetical protein
MDRNSLRFRPSHSARIAAFVSFWVPLALLGCDRGAPLSEPAAQGGPVAGVQANLTVRPPLAAQPRVIRGVPVGAARTEAIRLDDIIAQGRGNLAPILEYGPPNPKDDGEEAAAPAGRAPLAGSFQALAASGPTLPLAASIRAATTGGFPADSNGAVGPDHLVTAVNGTLLIQDRGGGVVRTLSMAGFFSSLGSFDLFDPNIFYDPAAGRFILSMAADRSSPSSAILLAVSQSSDPTGAWFFYRFDVDPTDARWGDFPKMGFGGRWIVMTTSLVPGSALFAVFACSKADLYAGTARCSRFESTVQGTIVPALMTDPSVPVQYLAHHQSPSDGTVGIDTIGGEIGAEQLTMEAAVVTLPAGWNYAPGNPTFAPQLGSATGLDTGASHVASLVYRNGSLFGAETAFLPIPSTRCSVQWWQVSPTGAVIQFGRIDDPTNQVFYAYPTLAVNRDQDVLLGYARFSASQYAGSGYAFRAGSDELGTVRGDATLKAGEGTYVNLDGARNRWGDYSATAVDPANDRDLWTIQSYATTPPSTWATWWGKVEPAGGWTATTVAPAADAYVRDGTATTNFGADPTLQVKVTASAGTNRIVYLRFPLPAGSVGQARLRLHGARASGAAASIADAVYGVASTTWSETGITWNNRPSIGAVQANGVDVATLSQYYEWDVSSYVVAQKAAGATAVSFAVQMGTNTTAGPDTFDSREAASNRPELVLSVRTAADAPPTVATPAAASPSPVTGASTTLSVLGGDDGGEANLTYTWATTGTPPAPVTFSANGTNAARSTTATFSAAGSYAFQVTIRDGGGQTASSSVTVAVQPTPTGVAVSPATATVPVGGTQAFSATARDQFGQPLAAQPAFTWSVSGGGTVSGAGVFTAGTTSGGPFTVRASGGAISGTASVTVSTGSTPVTLAPAADAHVRDGSATTNFGTATTLEVKNSTTAGNNRVVYLRFPLTGVGATVSNARLRLFGMRASGTSASITDSALAVASTTWSETTLTWNNRPAVGAVQASVAIATTARYYEWDVTAYVQAQRTAGATQISLAVRMDTAVGSSPDTFNAREATGNRPQLVVTASP